MKIKFILPALEEAKSCYWRPIKYSLFPPLGLATLASLCSNGDEAEITDEHVEELNTDDTPDLVVIQTYITNAYRAYEIADIYRKKGVKTAIGGLHATSVPQESRKHADVLFLGPAEESFPEFLRELKSGNHRATYISKQRSLTNMPLPRRDLFKKERYLVPNSIVISRGCVNRCDFCYSSSFFKNGKTFYTQQLDRILEEIDSLKGKHLYFLDDHLFADKRLAKDLFTHIKGAGRLIQGAMTVDSVIEDNLIELAREAGLRSAFIGFESLDNNNLISHTKSANLKNSYKKAISKLDSLGILINGSFIFGMEHDTKDVFQNTVEWALEQGISTATFHIMTPYPDTILYERLKKENRITSSDWRQYDTRHLVFKHHSMTKNEIEHGYNWAYKAFYEWKNIFNSSLQHQHLSMKLKHFFYSGSWKKFEPVWNFIIKNKMLRKARPLLERLLQ